MHRPSSGLAIGWSLWAKNRGLFLAFGLYLVVASVAAQWLPVREYPVVATLLMIPTAPLVTMFVVIFTMPEIVPTSKSRREGFPARMFTLPITTAGLVGWPMLWGSATVVLTWFALAGLVLRPCGFDAPLLLPAASLVAALAFFQAVAWAPFGPMIVRAPVVVALAPAMALAPFWAVEMWGLSRALYGVFLSAYIAAAFVVAKAGVARDRRGDTSATLTRALDWLADRVRRPNRPFGSADRAQLWFEWRGSGYVYPSFAGLMLVLCMVVAGFLGTPDTGIATLSLTMIVFFMGLMSALVGGALAKTHFQARESGISAFTLARPMSSGGLVAAKLKAAALSAIAGWVLVFLIVPPCFLLMGYGGPLATLWSQVLPAQPVVKTLLVAPVAVAALVLLTWRGLVGGLAVGLAARVWIAVLNVAAIYISVGAAIAIASWLQSNPEKQRPFVEALPWFLGIALTVKGLLAGWVLTAAVRRGHISSRTLRAGGVLWLLTGLALIALLWSLLPAANRSVALLVPAAFLSLPLTRLAAAPLALDLQRHR